MTTRDKIDNIPCTAENDTIRKILNVMEEMAATIERLEAENAKNKKAIYRSQLATSLIKAPNV